jgi:hypothetical protein
VEMPLVHVGADGVIMCMDRGRVKPAQDQGLTPEQRQALDAIETSAEKNKLNLGLEVGDVAFINNLRHLHSRGSYEDSDISSRRLTRLWVSNKMDDVVPAEMRVPWDFAFGEKARQVNPRYEVEPPNLYEQPL